MQRLGGPARRCRMIPRSQVGGGRFAGLPARALLGRAPRWMLPPTARLQTPASRRQDETRIPNGQDKPPAVAPVRAQTRFLLAPPLRVHSRRRGRPGSDDRRRILPHLGFVVSILHSTAVFIPNLVSQATAHGAGAGSNIRSLEQAHEPAR